MNPVPEPGWGLPPTSAPASQPFPAQQPGYGYPPAGGYPTGGQPGQPGQFGQPGYFGQPGHLGVPAPPFAMKPAGPKPPVTRLVTAVLLILTGVLAIVGSFLTLDTITSSGNTVDSSNTGWNFTFLTGTNSTASVIQWLGVSLAIGGALAIVAGTMMLVGGNRPLPLAQPLAIAGAGLTFGGTLSALSTVLTDINITGKQDTGSGTVADHPGIATYLLIASALGAVVVLVMLVRPATRGNTTQFGSAPTGYAPPVTFGGYGTVPGHNVAPPPGYGQQPMPQQHLYQQPMAQQPPTPPTGYGQPPTYGPVYQQPSDAYPQQPSGEQPTPAEGQTTHLQPPGQQ